jgi:hypothetical protein
VTVSAAHRLAIVLSAVVLWGAAPASAATVMLVQPPSPSPALAEAIVRVRGELISEGFQVEVMEGLQGTESRRWLEQLAETRKADAVVAVLGDETPDSVEVWVIDKVTEKTVVRRIPFKSQSEQETKTFAIHALELLRASFLEIDLRPSTRPSETKSVPQAVAHFVDGKRAADAPAAGEVLPAAADARSADSEKPASEPKPARVATVHARLVDGEETPASRRVRFGVEVGGAALVGFGDVGPAILPIVSVGLSIGPSWVTEVSAAGLGSRANVESGGGRAKVAEEFALLGARYRFLAHRRVRPAISLSAGALHTRAEGQAALPELGRNDTLWSFLVDGSVGLDLALAGWLELAFAAHAQLAEPYPAIRFDRTVVATANRPSLLFTLTMGTWL